MILWFYDSIKLDAALQMQPHQCAAERNNNFSHSACCAFANLNWDEVGLYHCEGTLLSHVELLVQQDPKELFCRAVSQSASPSLSWCQGSLHPRCRSLPLLWLNFVRFLLAQYSSPLQSPWITALPTCQHVSCSPPGLESSLRLETVWCSVS